MDATSRIKFAISVLLLATLACGVNLTAPSAQPPAGQVDTAVAQSIAGTSAVQTAIAQGVAGTMGPGQPSLQPELPSLTPTISLTPTMTLTTTVEKVMLTVSQTTNCRKGPGAVYDWVGALDPGEQVEVIAKDPQGSSWYIRNPDNSSVFCWIFGQYAIITGNHGALPVYTPMPTPTIAITKTPTALPADFTVSYQSIEDCSGGGVGEYWINFDILNTGNVTWQSWFGSVTDTATGQTTAAGWNFFHYVVGCASSTLQDDLTKGESGGVYTGAFANNPTGHAIIAIIRLCTLDDYHGTCLTKEIHFTP